MAVDRRSHPARREGRGVETYNTALEHHLTTFLRVRFAERPGGDRSKRPVREIVGVDPRLNQRWSARRQVIDVRRAELAAAFAQDHGRPPGRVEMLHLSQHATLETRDRKHEPRTLMEQRSVWRTEAVETLGGDHAVAVMLQQALTLSVTADPVVIDTLRVETADRVVAALEEHRDLAVLAPLGRDPASAARLRHQPSRHRRRGRGGCGGGIQPINPTHAGR